MLPEVIFERRKCLVTNFPGKGEKSAKAILKIDELFINAYIHPNGKSFCKNMHTDNISMNCIQEYVSISASKMSTIFICKASIIYF